MTRGLTGRLDRGPDVSSPHRLFRPLSFLSLAARNRGPAHPIRRSFTTSSHPVLLPSRSHMTCSAIPLLKDTLPPLVSTYYDSDLPTTFGGPDLAHSFVACVGEYTLLATPTSQHGLSPSSRPAHSPPRSVHSSTLFANTLVQISLFTVPRNDTPILAHFAYRRGFSLRFEQQPVAPYREGVKEPKNTRNSV